MHELEDHQNENNLLVNGTDNALILAYNSRFSFSANTSVNVVGGPLAASGNPQQGKTIIYGGLEWGNNLSHTLSNGANLLIRDAWYESSQLGPYANVTGSGTFTLEGSHVSSPTTTASPQISISGFSGKSTILNTFIWDTVSIDGNGSNTKFLGLGLQFGDYTLPVQSAATSYINNTTSPAGDIRSFNCRANNDPNLATPRSGSYAVNNIGTADSTFIATMIDPLRNVHAQVLTSLANGITDVRFYRVWLYKSLTGLDIEGNATILPVKFLSINSQCKNGGTSLTWKVAEQNDLKKFDIEKSDNGSKWDVIKSVNVSGNNSIDNSYSYQDNANGSSSIYRIVAYDINGAKILSNAVKPSCSFNNTTFLIYPNPVKGTTTVSVATDKAVVIEIILYDNKGAIVKKYEANLLPGNNSLPVDMQGLSNGAYTLHAIWGNNVKVNKVVKIN